MSTYVGFQKFEAPCDCVDECEYSRLQFVILEEDPETVVSFILKANASPCAGGGGFIRIINQVYSDLQDLIEAYNATWATTYGAGNLEVTTNDGILYELRFKRSYFEGIGFNPCTTRLYGCFTNLRGAVLNDNLALCCDD